MYVCMHVLSDYLHLFVSRSGCFYNANVSRQTHSEFALVVPSTPWSRFRDATLDFSHPVLLSAPTLLSHLVLQHSSVSASSVMTLMTLTTENGKFMRIVMAGRLVLLQEGDLDSKCAALHVQVQRKVCRASIFPACLGAKIEGFWGLWDGCRT